MHGHFSVIAIWLAIMIMADILQGSVPIDQTKRQNINAEQFY